MVVMCRVDDCDREARYIGARLCQKHYFRVMRGGTTSLRISRKYRTTHTSGYQVLYEPKHPLANASGYIYEHRLVMYGFFGNALPPCDMCGAELTWETCHIDHIDCDVTNNRRANLRQTCRYCNIGRAQRVEHMYSDRIKITIDGVTMTATEWARVSGVSVTGSTIRRRKSLGASDIDAVYGDKKTHNGRGKKKARSLPSSGHAKN